MKIKNLNFVDKHIHKIILAVSVLFFALVVFIYVMGSPYKASIANMKGLTPPQVVAEYTNAGIKLRSAISSQENPLPSMKIPDYNDSFHLRTVRSPVGVSAFETPIGLPGLDPKIIAVTVIESVEYKIDTPPFPRQYTLATGFNVLNPPTNQPQLTAQFIKLIGDKQPRDFHYVSVGSAFDRGAWRSQLLNVSAGARIPEEWWRNNVLLTYIKLERQTLNPATRKWGPVETIAPLPGQVDYSTVSERLNATDAVQMVLDVRQNQASIARPAFVPVAPTSPWLPPVPGGAAATPSEQRTKELREQINTVRTKLATLVAAARSAAPAPRTTAPPRPVGPGPGPGPGAPAGGGPPPPDAGYGGGPPPPDAGYGGGAPPSAAPPAAAPVPAPENVTSPEIEKLRAEYARLNTELGGQVRGSLPGDDDNRISIWTHDVTVVPGATYRYRLRPAVLNPLYQRREPIAKQREQQANKLSWVAEFPENDDSVWSRPITIANESRFYFVKSTRPNGVVAEVFRVFGGAWRSQEFTVAPGDTIGGTVNVKVGSETQSVNFGVGAVVVDIEYPSSALGGNSGGANTTRVLYVDLATNELRTRVIEIDKDNPELLELRAGK